MKKGGKKVSLTVSETVLDLPDDERERKLNAALNIIAATVCSELNKKGKPQITPDKARRAVIYWANESDRQKKNLPCQDR